MDASADRRGAAWRTAGTGCAVSIAGFVGSWRTTYLNFRRYDAPFPVKLRLFARNKWTMARTLSLCCGNLGEPGC